MHPGGQRGPEDGGALTEHGGVASKADGRRVAIHRLKGEVGVQLLLEHREQVISQRRVRYLHPRLAVRLRGRGRLRGRLGWRVRYRLRGRLG